VDASQNVSAVGSLGTTISSKTAEFNAAGGSIYSSYNDGTKTWRTGVGIFAAGQFSIRNATDSLQAIDITSAGNVGIGTSSPSVLLSVSKDGGSGDAGQLGRFTDTNTANAVGPTSLTIGMMNHFAAAPKMSIAGTTGLSFCVGDGSNFATQRKVEIDSSGNLLVGQTSGSYNIIAKSRTSDAGEVILSVERQQTSVSALLCYGISQSNYNAANSGNKMGRDGTTLRSLNAGGTVNASGADYAEYMVKSGEFTVAKGAVVGIDAQGKLTNVFADAVSFCVKSTDPSYVGGDIWGTEDAIGLVQPTQPTQRQATEDAEAETDEDFTIRQSQYESDKATFDAALEAARQTVDRIAFAGQVPVNVLGATAGQYIIPVNDNGAIKGEAVSNPTFEQYQIAVGKVIAIEQDGRAKIIVKVA
jgi:hypothetical protein